MKRCFLLMVCFMLAMASGCQEGPKGDPAFKKEQADPEVFEVKDKGNKLQEAPGA
jgi:hypothetical protein